MSIIFANPLAATEANHGYPFLDKLFMSQMTLAHLASKSFLGDGRLDLQFLLSLGGNLYLARCLEHLMQSARRHLLLLMH